MCKYVCVIPAYVFCIVVGNSQTINIATKYVIWVSSEIRDLG